MRDLTRKFDVADLRSRYEAMGTEKVFFSVALVATTLGALLPLLRTPTVFFFSAGSDVRFYNLGFAGWLVFVAFAALVVAPLVRPALTVGRWAVRLLGIAGALVGMALTLLAVSSYGLIVAGPGVYAWLLAASALVLAYSRRIGLE